MRKRLIKKVVASKEKSKITIKLKPLSSRGLSYDEKKRIRELEQKILALAY